MMNVWQIASGDVGRDYSSLFFNYDMMILGPSLELGDASDNPEKYRDGIPNSSNNQVWSFYSKPQPGDRVVMRYNKEIIGIGQIPNESENQYSFQEQFKCVYGWNLCHTRRVIWMNKQDEIPKKIRTAFADRMQQPSFTAVNDPLKQLIINLPDDNFKRKLKSLPDINYRNYNVEELGRELFKNGISNKNIEDIINALNQADRLINWYTSDNSGRDPSEHEVVSHIILPIFLGLGWSHQQIAVEWNKIDVAFFKTTPTTNENCVMIIEAKGLGKSLGEVLEQPLNYIESRSLKNVRLIITTDGANVFVYEIKKNKVDVNPIGFFNVNHLQKEYILPKGINLVDTLVKLQPISL